MTGLSDELNRLNTEGWSTREIERIAERHGHKLHYSTVSNYMGGRHAKPSPRVLDAFAAVFGVDVNQLRDVADLPSVGTHFDLGPDASRLTGPQRDVIRTTVRLFVEQNDALADRSVSDGAINTAKIPLPDDPWRLAANRGPKPLRDEDRRAAERGEESQDPGTDEPA